MKNNFGKRVIILAFGLFVFFIGYFRNYVFITINSQASAVYYHEQGPEMPSFLQFIATKDYSYLITLKYILTAAFTLVFFVIAIVGIKYFFRQPVLIKIPIIFYSFLLFAVAIIGLAGKLIKPFAQHAFNIARNLLHITQSPFTILFLFIVAYYYQRVNNKA